MISEWPWNSATWAHSQPQLSLPTARLLGRLCITSQLCWLVDRPSLKPSTNNSGCSIHMAAPASNVDQIFGSSREMPCDHSKLPTLAVTSSLGPSQSGSATKYFNLASLLTLELPYSQLPTPIANLRCGDPSLLCSSACCGSPTTEAPPLSLFTKLVSRRAISPLGHRYCN